MTGDCAGTENSRGESDTEGEVLTFTTVHSVPEGFTAPLELALVQLRNGRKILCESRCSDIAIGKKVHVAKDGKKPFCANSTS
jgi:uncharacterized OB-fold protein